MDKLVFDIGGTNTKFALMSVDGKILVQEKIPTDYSSAGAFFHNLEQLVTKYKGRGDAIAISTNGRMTQDGNSYRAYVMNCLQGVNLKEELEKRTGLPVTVLNDGFSAALGEWWKGAGQGSKNLLVLVLGSGMGGGLILDGKLYQGNRLNAAMVFGMLSAYGYDKYDISGITTTFALLLYQLSAMKQIPMEEMTGPRFFEFVAAGDPVAVGMLDLYCESVAGIIYNSTLLLDLDCTVVTGGLTSQDILMKTIERKLQEIPEKIFQGQVASFLEMASVDRNDFQVSVKKGELALDANIYGALYYMVNKEA
jgi:predicted NBD/HSP70 family sugar kinase